MCGRYALTTPPEAMRDLFRFVERPNLAPRYNICPTQDAPVLRQRREPRGERTLQLLRWGLIPAWAKDGRIGATLINARAETLVEKPAFRAAFRRRRCVVPADGFYEWRGTGAVKEPCLVTRRDGAPLVFAGLWERWTPAPGDAVDVPFIDSFTIVTTRANELLRPLHERMPVILSDDGVARWLDPEAEAAALLPLLAPSPNALLQYFPVSRRVNGVRDDDADLMAPTGPVTAWPAPA